VRGEGKEGGGDIDPLARFWQSRHLDKEPHSSGPGQAKPGRFTYRPSDFDLLSGSMTQRHDAL